VFNFCNFAAYQLAWFAVILGAAHDLAWAGAALALLVTAVHLWLRRDPLELRLVGLAALIGAVLDTALAMTGQVHFASSWPLAIAPFWMLSLWMAFATTLNHSLRWLMNQPLAAAAAGALGGPLAYLAGARLGALSLDRPLRTLPLIALLWMAAMLLLSRRVLRATVLPEARRLPA
jgi:hypothetical protein